MMNLLNFGIGFIFGWLFGRIVGFILIVGFIWYAAMYVQESDAHKAERLTNEALWKKTQDEQSGHANGNGWYAAPRGNTWGLSEGAPIKVQTAKPTLQTVGHWGQSSP